MHCGKFDITLTKIIQLPENALKSKYIVLVLHHSLKICKIECVTNCFECITPTS